MSGPAADESELVARPAPLTIAFRLPPEIFEPIRMQDVPRRGWLREETQQAPKPLDAKEDVVVREDEEL